ncbi:hypothetical protein [Pseudoalteromonas sp. B160]|uniref:hypothetical protein n=1 Tax=Pseudoalteromonas sp. B160 TaxID=630414 RepID=UPI00301C05FD
MFSITATTPLLADEVISSGWIVPANTPFQTTKPLLEQVVATDSKTDLSYVRIKVEQGYWFIIDLDKQSQSKIEVIYADNSHLAQLDFYTLDENFNPLVEVNNDAYRYVNKVLPHALLPEDEARWAVIYARHSEDDRLSIGLATGNEFANLINKKLRNFFLITGAITAVSCRCWHCIWFISSSKIALFTCLPNVCIE